METKWISFVVIFFFIGEFLSTDSSAVIYQPYILTSPGFPFLPLGLTDLKSTLDTDKPDVELGTKLIEFGTAIKTNIPRVRDVILRKSVNADWIEQFIPRLIDVAVKIKEGRSNLALRTSLSEEIRTLAEITNSTLNELDQLADMGSKIIQMSTQITDNLKEKKD